MTGPHDDDDTYDLIDDALASLAQRRGAWLGDPLTAITLIASLIAQAQRFLPEMVTEARDNGHSWEQIAQALATSPEQARLWFDPESRSQTADGHTALNHPHPATLSPVAPACRRSHKPRRA